MPFDGALPDLSGSITNVVFTFTPPVQYVWTQTVFFASNGGTTDVTLVGTGVPEPACLLLLALLATVRNVGLVRCVRRVSDR